MTARVRLGVALAGLLGLGVLLGWGLEGLPPVGSGPSTYTRAADRLSARDRMPEVVTFVVFDLRGIDTMGEEFILLASVAGVAVLLRPARRERERSEEVVEREDPLPPSDAVRVVGLAFAVAAGLFGVYLVSHGHLSPGGGFQGGAVAASAALTVFVVGGPHRFHRLAPPEVVDVTEGSGAAVFPILGAAGLAFGSGFLANVLPLGRAGDLLSAGTVPLLNVAVGVEVASGFLVIASEFVEQTLLVERGPG